MVPIHFGYRLCPSSEEIDDSLNKHFSSSVRDLGFIPTPSSLYLIKPSKLSAGVFRTSPLPSSIPSPSIADTFCSFFSDKISSVRFTLQSFQDSHAASTGPLPSPSPTFPISNSSLPSLFPASEAEVSFLVNSLPNKQCELDPSPPLF